MYSGVAVCPQQLEVDDSLTTTQLVLFPKENGVVMYDQQPMQQYSQQLSQLHAANHQTTAAAPSSNDENHTGTGQASGHVMRPPNQKPQAASRKRVHWLVLAAANTRASSIQNSCTALSAYEPGAQ